jgi:hypothetical protein
MEYFLNFFIFTRDFLLFNFFFRCFRKAKKKLKIKFITLISEEFPFIAEKRQDLKQLTNGKRKKRRIYTQPALSSYLFNSSSQMRQSKNEEECE